MSERARRYLGLTVLTVMYPLTAPLLQGVPNPMVPGAIVALHMIFPVLAGFFYGPASGAVAGGLGTLAAWLLFGCVFDMLSIIPHLLMGGLAGWLGRNRSEYLAALALALGHLLNVLVYIAYGALVVEPEKVGVTILGLATETSVGLVAMILVGGLLKDRLYQTERI